MPCEVKPRFVVLYGSQKGQAQSMAEGIAEEAEEHGLVAELSCLNQNEKVTLVLKVELLKFFLHCMANDTVTHQYQPGKCDVVRWVFNMDYGEHQLLINHITGSSTIWRRRMPQWSLLCPLLETGNHQTMPSNL